MGIIRDIYGRLLGRKTLTQTQTDDDIRYQQVAEHPSLGIDIRRVYEIFSHAEQGELTRQSDLFFDIEERDGHIFAELSKRRRAVMPLAWQIVPPRNATAQEKSMAAAATEWFEDLPDFSTLLFDLLDAVGHGFSPVEIEWEQAERIWLPRTFHKRPQRWFQTASRDRNHINLIDGSMDGAALQPFGWLLHRHQAKSGWVAESGLFRVLVWTYLFKNISARDLAEFLEIYGLPMRVGTYSDGATEEEKNTLLWALRDLGHNAGGIVHERTKIAFESAAQGQVDPFQYMLEWCESTQSKVILGGTLTTQADGKTSTNALGNVHNEVRHDLMASDAVQLAGTLTRDLLYPLLKLNGFSDISPRRMCRFVFDTREPEDLKESADAINVLVSAGVPVPVQWALDKTGIPAAKDNEAILQPVSAVSPLAGLSALGQLAPRLAALNITSGNEPEAQTVLDNAPSSLTAVSAEAMDTLLAPVLSALKQGNTPEEALQIISEAYPTLDDAQLQAMLTRIIFVSDVWGRINAG
jgi:phage gp29-like protein